ncbi:hypothetical protein H6P81_021057 [Aristolochia fimbriata]|uniref:Uncharacterized protein n=1 Tax=Aristolochia fimbriata TaxID=158543 RepID=A0AAV7E0I1_ARIFI|nr:hypothetical protein H6P81_021057 [Aristolochia fimbriata]
MQRSTEITDPFESIVHEGTIPNDLRRVVENLPVAGKSSQPRPGTSSSVVFPPRDRTPTTVKDDAGVGKVGVFAKLAGGSVRRSKEIVDPFEFIVHEGRIPNELQNIVKDFPVAGKSSQRRPGASSSAVVAPLRERNAGTEKDAGVGKVGLGAKVSGEGSAATAGSSMFEAAGDALRFADVVMNSFGFTEFELSMESPCLESSVGFSLEPPSRNTRVPATEVVPVTDTAAKVRISESKKELAVSLVRKSPMPVTPDNIEADDRTLSRKRKANSMGEPMQQTDLGVLTRKEDPLSKFETSHQNFAEKSNLGSRQNAAEQSSIEVDKGPGETSYAEGNTRGKKEAAAIGRRTLPRSFSISEPPISQSRTRGARMRDETVEDPVTKSDADKSNADGGENLGVPEVGIGNLLCFLEAVKMLCKNTDRSTDQGNKDESLLSVARRAGYTFYSYNPKSRAA